MPLRWGDREQRFRFRGECVAHVYPLAGRKHVLEGHPMTRCWCGARIEIREDGSLVHHNLVH